MLPSLKSRTASAASMLLLLLAISFITAAAARPLTSKSAQQPGNKVTRKAAAALAPPAPAPAPQQQQRRASFKLPPRRPSELSNSFIITTIQDLEPQMVADKLQTPCEYAVQKARSIGGKHFSLVVTAYWMGGPNNVDRYAYKSVDSNGVAYLTLDKRVISRFKKGLQTCFRSAIYAGFNGVQILNHIDQGTGSPAWRNMLDFDPLEQHQGLTFEDVVVRPAADALRTTSRPSTQVWFMLSGETGRSIFKHPKEYTKLLSKYRGSLTRGKAGANVKVGLALHWNKVCGDCFPVPGVTAAEYNASYAKAFADNKAMLTSQYDLPALRRLFEDTEVLGLSHYAPLMPDQLTVTSFELPFTTCAYELSFFGIDLRRLLASNSRDFLFSEVGVGGGASDGRSAATDLQSLVGHVEQGIWAVYNTAQDPWKRPDYRDYRRSYFHNLLGFLRRGGGPQIKIDAAFVWSVGSFDVAAVHPISSSAEGTYADAEIVGWMEDLSSSVV